MSEPTQTTIDDFEDGDEITVEYTNNYNGSRQTINGEVVVKFNGVATHAVIDTDDGRRYAVDDEQIRRQIDGEFKDVSASDPAIEVRRRADGYRGLGDTTAEHRPNEDAVLITDGGELALEDLRGFDVPTAVYTKPLLDRGYSDVPDFDVYMALCDDVSDSVARAIRTPLPEPSPASGSETAQTKLVTDGGSARDCRKCDGLCSRPLKHNTERSDERWGVK